MLVTETFHGYIETTQDVLLIFEGCRRGLLPRICRRLQERERKMIRSGSIFVFDERESGKVRIRKEISRKKLINISRHQTLDRWSSLESLSYLRQLFNLSRIGQESRRKEDNSNE